MGSSKKHKEKERESRKRHRRSRSKERDRHGVSGNNANPSSSHRDRKQEKRSRSRSRDRDRKRTKEHNDERSSHTEKQRVKDNDTRESDSEIRTTSSGNEVSLSIQETNKLRAKLGLKPLDVPGESKDGGDNDGEKKQEFVHKPAENLANKAYVEKLREKIALQKEKRKIQDKLKRVKGLGDSDSEEESAISWVHKSRIIETEKQKAEKRAKMLEEMDEEFGVGSLVEDEFKRELSKAYTGKNLKGLKVEHSEERFLDERNFILTIKDKGVLDEDDDVLVNVNIVDDERAEKNAQIRSKKPTYDAYEDDMDEFGKPKSLLNKYDEEIDGEKKKSFVIGSGGKLDVNRAKELLEIRKKLLHKNAESLAMPSLTIASEYYSEQEMVTFKKPKKVRKLTKSKRLRADELGAIVNEHNADRDLGSRKRRGNRSKEENEELKEELLEDMDTDEPILNFDDNDSIGPDEDLSGIVIEPDEAEHELQLALNKARKIKQREATVMDKNDSVKFKTENTPSEEMNRDQQKGFIVMNSTAEFCRALGDIPTYGLSGNREEDVDDLLDFERDMVEERKKMEEDPNKQNVGAWNEVDIDEKPVEIKKEDAPILEEEPDVSTGLAGALKLAMKKGYLEKETKKMASAPRHSQLEAANYTIEDKSFFEDDKYGRRDRYCAGPVTDFREKDTYKPDVKLEYIDDSGRLLTPKEAFRYLSHKFHGKGSGKNKTEKRMKKLQEEALMKQMSSTDTPLGTLTLLQDKQKQTQSPFILLSGGSKALNPNAIAKPT